MVKYYIELCVRRYIFVCLLVRLIFGLSSIVCIKIGVNDHVSFAAYLGISWDFLALGEI